MIPIELSDSFHRGDVVLFLGAGLSMGAGLPGWTELVKPLAQRVNSSWPRKTSDISVTHLLDALQRYENVNGRQALISKLRDSLDTTGKPSTAAHKAVAELGIRAIFTTNYDDLIEREFRSSHRKVNVVVEDAAIPYMTSDTAQVIKLCGDLDHPGSIVITKTDFSTYFASHAHLAQRLRSELEIRTPLFLGYSLRDPFFDQIWDTIGMDFGRHRRYGYAVLFDPPKAEVEDLHNRGLQVIDLQAGRQGKTRSLATWLEMLRLKHAP